MQTQVSAILVAHGQPSDPEPAEDLLAQFGARVSARLPTHTVRTATLATPNLLEEVCASVSAGSVVYPCFMASGWFTSKVLPKRLEGFALRTLSPLGAEPDLPPLVADHLTHEIKNMGLTLHDTGVLLAAHGSARGNKAAEAAHAFLSELTQTLPVREISAAFVEQDPRILYEAERMSAPSLCLPFFALEGDHVRDDIRGALETARFAGPLLPVITDLPGVDQIVAKSLSRALAASSETVPS